MNSEIPETLELWADWLNAKVMYESFASIGDGSYYTITRDIAGGPFTARYRGIAISEPGRLKTAKAAAQKHNGSRHKLIWTEPANRQALML